MPGTNSAPCYADDANMDYCTPYPWPASTYGNRFGNAMVNLDSQTDMYDTYQATCGPQTDIGGYLNSSPEITLSPSVRGIALCTKPLNGWGSTRCDQGSMVINANIVSGAQASKTMCHEIGHFTGLWHYSGTAYSCMVSGSSTLTSYNSTEVSMINGKY